ncbi:MAG: imidazole glycerol phosphate synthase subunit HisH [Candidatus Bathyarchaeota archaeon]|nr:MAG: imidazole glycerol phosphate synthase subunit HisH [Candidatus Bathyarchaeota archaeon]
MPEAIIFDYGVGNLLSLKCALEKVGLNAKITVSSHQLKNADAIALPGVGSFSAATTKLNAVKEHLAYAVESGTPLLGICIGLQLFFKESDEGPGIGLALFEGKSVRLPRSVKVPHMGWNTLRIVKQNQLFEGVDDESYVYFVHSLYPVLVDKEIVTAETKYGTTFASAIASESVYGTQFHPEKSGDVGLKILGNFAKIVKR